MESGYRFFAGIDLGAQKHQACALNAERRLLLERSVEHAGPAIAELADALARLADGEASCVAVGLEVPHGAVVETLVERGFAVFSINPKQVDRFRDRHSVAGAKDDRRDAFVIADSLRTDAHHFRRVRAEDPLVIQIREASRSEQGLKKDARRLANQLRDQLHRFFPQLLQLSPAADDPWLWDLLRVAPPPQRAAAMTEEQALRLLRRHRIRRFPASELLALLRTPPLCVAPGTVEAASDQIAFLLPALRLLHFQKRRCSDRLEALLDRLGAPEATQDQRRIYGDLQLLLSLPGVGTVVASVFLAEASQPLADRDYPCLRTQSGAAPVTRQSGTRKQVVMRHACNPRLRDVLYHWARVAAQMDPQSRSRYAALRARGRSHGTALRSVGDRLLAVLVAMLKTGTPYDPARRAAQALPLITPELRS